MSKLEPLMPLNPYCLEKIWGGNLLTKLKGLSNKNPIGETWEVSCLKDCSSTFKGLPLADFIETNDLSHLAKFIQTTDNLSIQVHPDDDFAMKYEKSRGKSECWIVLGASSKSGIYLGLKNKVTQEEFRRSLENGDEVEKLLNFYSVSPGDFYFVPAKTIHAIGRDVFLLEIQQNCGLTYRVWDWNRVGLDGNPRELHVKRALEVINFSMKGNQEENFKVQKNIFDHEEKTQICSHNDFNVSILKMKKNESLVLNMLGKKRHLSLISIEGSFEIKRRDDVEFLSAYHTILCPSFFSQNIEIICSNDEGIIVIID